MLRVGILGYGKIADRMAAGWDLNPGVKVKTWLKPGNSCSRKSVQVHRHKEDLLKSTDLLILSVKPHQAKNLVVSLGDDLDGKTVVSTCAGLSLTQLRHWNSKVQWARAMPNTPVSVGQGVTALHFGEDRVFRDKKKIMDLFSRLGFVTEVPESQLDAVTGMSGCGPAYVFLILEALAEAGVKVGIPRDVSQKLAAHTLQGAATLALQDGRHPAQLKDEVTTPAGCTIDGLMALEEGALRSTLIRAVVAATEKSKSFQS
jgi:pyrroline-5-carboxylate reductase